MRGMEIMLANMMKSLGFNPEIVMTAIQQMAAGVVEMNERQARIETRMARLEALQRGEVLPDLDTKPHLIEGEVNGTSQ